MLVRRRFYCEATRFVAGVIAVALLCAPIGVAAQTVKPAKKASDVQVARRDPAEAQRAYAAGTRAYEAGNFGTAIQQLSIALENGGLGNPQMARALYFRGASYRQQGKPAQAISDLTTALWIKNGLAGSDKTQATELRQTAYQEAGLGDVAPPVGGSASATASAKAAPATPVQPATKPGAQVATVPAQSSFWNALPTLPSLQSIIPSVGLSQTAEAPQAAQPAAEATPVAAVVPGPVEAPAPQAEVAPAAPTGGWDASTSAAPTPPQSYGLAAGGPASESQAQSAPTNTVSGFFSNLFGGSNAASQATSTPSSQVVTGSTISDAQSPAALAPAPQTSSVVQRGPDIPAEVLPWTSQPAQTSPAPQPAVEAVAPVITAGRSAPLTEPTQQVALVTPEAAPAPAVQKPKRQLTQPGGGKFRLQVAAVRSREQADQVAQALQSHPDVVGSNVQTEVEEAAFGAAGTFYRVRLGPYGDAIAPNQLCKVLRPQGYDCLVVTQ